MKRANLNKAITLALSVVAAGCASTGLKTEIPTTTTTSMTWTETFRVECHLGKSQEREVTCTHEGEQVRLRYGCGKKVAEYVYSCQHRPGAPATQPLPEATTTETVAEDTDSKVGHILGKWGVGARGLYMDASKDGGPSLGGMDFTFVGDLRMAGNWLFFHFEVGPGFLKGDDIESLSLTEFVGVRAEATNWFAVTAGGRHRVAFDGETDDLNAFLVELQLGFMPLTWLELGLSGAIGHTIFPEVTRVTTPRPDGNLDYLDLQSAGKGLGFSVGGGATVRF